MRQSETAPPGALTPSEFALLRARAAEVQFNLAALLEAPIETLRERSLVTAGGGGGSDAVSPSGAAQPQIAIESGNVDGRRAGRLPSAWYKQADELADAARRERMAVAVRGAAGACVVTGVALLFWLGAFSDKNGTPNQFTAATSLAPVRQAALALPAPATGIEAILPPIDGNARALVTTAQILAVAERFVATGEILAARAILSDKAASGDARALFALAETYDPNLLASWDAQNAEPSILYARLLYEAALKNGLADAQTRLDALK